MNLETVERSHIKSGTIIHNYKVACALFNEPVKKASSKQAQLKEWRRYFDFTTQGKRLL